MYKRLLKFANPFQIIFALTLVIVFNFFIFPAFKFTSDGQHFQILDLRLEYNLTDVIDLFTNLNTEGRNLYTWMIATVDMIYPLIYGAMLVLLMLYSLNKIVVKKPFFQPLAILPFGTVTMDYFENFNTLLMLLSFPTISSFAAEFGSFVTTLKWIFLALTFITLAFIWIFWLIRFFKTKTQSN